MAVMKTIYQQRKDSKCWQKLKFLILYYGLTDREGNIILVVDVINKEGLAEFTEYKLVSEGGE